MTSRRVILACAMSSLLAACGSNQFQSNNQDNASRAENLKNLNSLAQNETDDVSIHFDRIDQVQVLAVSATVNGGCAEPGPAVPAGINCQLVDPNPSRQTYYASITGDGSIKGSTANAPQARGLNLVVAFDPTINYGQACLGKAQNALIRALQLEIKGKAKLIPVADPGFSDGSSGGGSSDNGGFIGEGTPPGTNMPTLPPVGHMITTANEIESKKLDQPIFIALDVGVVLDAISSCEEGGPAVTPPPKPTPGPGPEPIPYINQYKIRLSEVTSVSRAEVTPHTGADGAARIYLQPSAYIAGKGQVNDSKDVSQVGIQLDDTAETASCLSLAQRQMAATDIRKRGLNIDGSGWDLPIPMLACALGDCPTFINVRLNKVISCTAAD